MLSHLDRWAAKARRAAEWAIDAPEWAAGAGVALARASLAARMVDTAAFEGVPAARGRLTAPHAARVAPRIAPRSRPLHGVAEAAVPAAVSLAAVDSTIGVKLL